MADLVGIDMTPEEWGQVMIVLQGGVYRVVAPLLNKISGQLTSQLQLRVVSSEGETVRETGD